MIKKQNKDSGERWSIASPASSPISRIVVAMAILGFIMSSLIGMILAIVGLGSLKEVGGQICVPRIAGSYIPLNEEDPALIVFDLKDPEQNQLFRDVQKYQIQIKNG